MVAFGVTKVNISYFFKITNVEVSQKVDQAKIAFILV